MRAWFVVVLLAAMASSSLGVPFRRYDVEDRDRIVAELRRLGVVLDQVTQLDEPNNPPPPTVSCPAGDFEGYWNETQFGRTFAAFEGIPYAQPPVGSLIFKLAQPFTHRLENFQAKNPGSACMQRNTVVHSLLIEGQEDCLFINVYTPNSGATKCSGKPQPKSQLLPVIFYIHGGGLFSGYGSLYRPNILLDQDIVLVTINYRLGPLGFLTTEDGVIPSNIGLKDQVEALRWVHKNIDAFGGDPNLVTIFGQSAGSACVEFHTVSPLSRGLFHRAISNSGQAIAPWVLAPPGETARNRQTAAEFWGCPTKPSSALLECLSNKTGDEIIDVDYTFVQWGMFPVVPFKAVIEGEVEGAFLPLDPLQSIAEGNLNDVPYMSGINYEDGGVFGLGIFTNETQVAEFDANFTTLLPLVLMLDDRASEKTKTAVTESYRRAYFPPGPITKEDASEGITMLTDTLFLYRLIEDKRVRIRYAKAPTYTRLFSYEAERSFSKQLGDPINTYGTAHFDELLYLFDFSAVFGPPTASDVWMSMFMTDVYASFAKNGIPSSNITNVVWKRTTNSGEKMQYLSIGGPEAISMKTNMLPERWRYVEEIMKIIQKDVNNRSP